MTVADRIRERRKELGYSQEEFAKRMGYQDKTSISKIENSGNDITMKKISKIAAGLDVTPEYLMGWESAERAEEFIRFNEYFNTIAQEKEKKAMDLYALYQKASPDVQKAVEVLLKFEPPQS